MPDFARVTEPWRTGADGKERGRTNRWCPGAELNHRHRDFQSRALPTELPGRRPRNECSRRAARYKGSIEACPATQNGRGDTPATRSLGSLVAWIDIIRASLIRLVIVLLRCRDRVTAAQPAVQVDVGAAARAERPKLLDARLAANRARLRSLGTPVQWVALVQQQGAIVAISSLFYASACKRPTQAAALTQPKWIG
jgi:hypothetical protein